MVLQPLATTTALKLTGGSSGPSYPHHHLAWSVAPPRAVAGAGGPSSGLSPRGRQAGNKDREDAEGAKSIEEAAHGSGRGQPAVPASDPHRVAAGVRRRLHWLWSDLVAVFTYLDSVVLWHKSGDRGQRRALSHQPERRADRPLRVWCGSVAGRNLPGLLEVLVLSKLRLAQARPMPSPPCSTTP